MRARYLFTSDTAEALPPLIKPWSWVIVNSSNAKDFTRRYDLAEDGPERVKARGAAANAAALLNMARRKKDRRFIEDALPPYFGITKISDKEPAPKIDGATSRFVVKPARLTTDVLLQ
jgi:hypothetical protein